LKRLIALAAMAFGFVSYVHACTLSNLSAVFCLLSASVNALLQNKLLFYPFQQR